MRTKQIKTFYTEKQVCFDSIKEKSYSQSPLKPALLMQRIKEGPYADMLDITSDFEPIKREDYHIAHTKEYVDNVFNMTGNYRSNSLPWSQNLVDSLPYTTGSLYAASKYAIENPETVCLAPVSGMHHARPNGGSGFCTFSGQVVSAIKIYQETGMSCAYFDLDGHYGNSIEDTRQFNPVLNKAIPYGCNVNPIGENATYVSDFEAHLFKIFKLIQAGKIHYVVFAHGADSHLSDDLGGQVGTEFWTMCAERFAEWVNKVSDMMGKPLPVVLALFGGYRKDDYNTVLDLHTKSLMRCSNIICGNDYEDNLVVTEKKYSYC
jgi:acetoin utilization deacetylase AcuC-like enzyme